MYLHQQDKNLFKKTLEIVTKKSKLNLKVIEKDYYVTLILRELSLRSPEVVFKGGTYLSKAHRVSNRFSEDVDIAFDEHIGHSRRKKIKYQLLLPISEELNLPILN